MAGDNGNQEDKEERTNRDQKRRTPTTQDYFIGYFIGCISAGFAETCVFPLDIIKTRMAMQGESASKDFAQQKSNSLKTMWHLGKHEGVKTLWFGLSAAWYRQFVYAGIRTQLYQFIRSKWGPNPDGTYPVWKACFTGSMAGVAGEFCASPFGKLKIQLQMEGLRKLKGYPPRVTGVWQGIFASYHKGGLKSVWRGGVPNCQRAALVNFAEMGFYDSSKRALMNDYGWQNKYFVTLTAGFIAGFWASVLACPAESVRARIINQPVDENGRGLYYKGTFDCLKQTVRKEGFTTLYHPFQPMWLKIGPFALIFWMTMETLRDWSGQPEF